MLHHAVAQTSPCCIAPVALAAAAEVEGDMPRGWSTGKKQTCFVIVSNGWPGLFLSGKQKMEKVRNPMQNCNKRKYSDGQRFSLFPSDLLQSTNWASLTHKIEQQSILSCQYASGLAQT